MIFGGRGKEEGGVGLVPRWVSSMQALFLRGIYLGDGGGCGRSVMHVNVASALM